MGPELPSNIRFAHTKLYAKLYLMLSSRLGRIYPCETMKKKSCSYTDSKKGTVYCPSMASPPIVSFIQTQLESGNRNEAFYNHCIHRITQLAILHFVPHFHLHLLFWRAIAVSYYSNNTS